MTNRDAALRALTERVVQTHADLGSAWPYHADPATGHWQTVSDGDWCAGHWIEALRIAAERTGDHRLLDDARARIDVLRPWREMDDMFRAPMFYYSAARMAEATGDKQLRALALEVADRIRAMAMPVNGAMPIGTQVRVKSTDLASRNIVAVDNVHPTLLLDWYAYAVTGDGTYADGARAHLEVTRRDFIRADCSTVEFIEYEPDTGQVRREFTLLGAHDHSCWSRGQAWAIGGYLRAYEQLREPADLALAEQLMDYWVRECGPDLIPPWDFKAEQDRTLPDTSAAAIVAESLARLAVVPDLPAAARPILRHLEPILDGLCARVTPIGPADPRPPGMLLDGCFNRPRGFADHHELVWGDVYLLSALHCLDRGGLPC